MIISSVITEKLIHTTAAQRQTYRVPTSFWRPNSATFKNHIYDFHGPPKQHETALL